MTSSTLIRARHGGFAAILAAAVILVAPQDTAAQSGRSENARGAGTAQETEEMARAEAAPDTSWLYELSPEELFLRASSSALQFQSMIAPSRRRLVADHATSLPYLVTRLDTDDARERHALEDILVRIGHPAVVPVIDAFGSEVRRTDTTRGARLAASVLGRLGDAAAVGPLGGTRDHEDWKVRGAAAGALGRIGVSEAVPPLVDLLTDGNEIVRKSAAFGLGRTASAVREACECDDATTGSEWERAVDELSEALDDPHYAVRYNAADALAKIGEPSTRALREILKRDAGPARLMALRSLGRLGSDDAVSAVSDLLDSDDWATRAHAVHALGMLGTDRSMRRELERMRDDEEHPFVLLRIEGALSLGVDTER
jgi:HEAT repeat protein